MNDNTPLDCEKSRLARYLTKYEDFYGKDSLLIKFHVWIKKQCKKKQK